MTKRWIKRPDGSNWGEFGEDDQRGRLNLLTPEKVLQAVAEVRVGTSFCLSLPLDRPGKGLNPARHPPRRFATVRHGLPSYNFRMSGLDP
ncbi:MAG: cyclase family protein, partial [Rhodospirillales bacterium]|nr:cyclase family protein [Rhodospirillales bacterium]